MKLLWHILIFLLLMAGLIIMVAVAESQIAPHDYTVLGPVLKGHMQWTVVEVRKDGIAIVRPMVAPDWGIGRAGNLVKGDVLDCEPRNVSDVSTIGTDGLPLAVHHLELECEGK